MILMQSWSLILRSLILRLKLVRGKNAGAIAEASQKKFAENTVDVIIATIPTKGGVIRSAAMDK